MKQFFGRKSRSTLTLVIMVSFALHIVAIVIFGTVKFVTALREKPDVFEAAPEVPPPQKEPEYTVNIKQRNQSTPPPRPPAIVVNNPSELDIPALDIDVNVDSTSVYGRGGGGFGGGLAGIREMAIGDLTLTDFGYTGRAAGTLEGTLIDLKRTKSGSPSSLSDKGNRKGAIRKFADGTWKLSRLTDNFYSAENKLYSSFWMIKFGSAARAPQSFGVENEIQPTGIVAYYEGSYTPKENMNMRFCGMGDDVLLVRLNSRIVLDASWEPGYSDFDFNQDGPSGLEGIPKAIRNGSWLSLRAGETYDLKILISEIPGGSFGCFLFYQLKDDDRLRVFSTKEITPKERKVLEEVNETVAKAVKVK